MSSSSSVLADHEYDLWNVTLDKMIPLLNERQLLESADLHDEIRQRRSFRYARDLELKIQAA